MRQAITTKYLGPTNSSGSRVKATAAAGSVTVHWDHALGVEANHTAAAKTLAVKMGWPGDYVGGGLPNEEGNVYVCAVAFYEHGPFTEPFSFTVAKVAP